MDELKQAVAFHVTRAAVKLRRQSSEARGLQVFISTNPFVSDDPQYHHTGTLELPAPTADTGLLIGQAMRGLTTIYREGYRYKKTGIMLWSLSPAQRRQGALFGAGDEEVTAADGDSRCRQCLDGTRDTTLRDRRLPPAVDHAPGTPVAGLYHAVVGRAGGEVVICGITSA